MSGFSTVHHIDHELHCDVVADRNDLNANDSDVVHGRSSLQYNLIVLDMGVQPGRQDAVAVHLERIVIKSEQVRKPLADMLLSRSKSLHR